MYTSEYPIINVTVDIITDIYMIDEHHRYVLLIERANEPFKGKLALPGGFIDPDEPAEAAAVRELEEETGLKIHEDVLELVDVASAPKRDPRGRTISIVYSYFIISTSAAEFKLSLKAGDDAANVVLLPVQNLNKDDLAFDHFDLIRRVHADTGVAGS